MYVMQHCGHEQSCPQSHWLAFMRDAAGQQDMLQHVGEHGAILAHPSRRLRSHGRDVEYARRVEGAAAC